MALLTLVDGKKGPHDILVLVTAYGEPLSFAEWLFIGKCYLDSEASYYPIQDGYLGKAMLINAINELSHGVSFDRVLERYGLSRKGKRLNIVDKRKAPLERRFAENAPYGTNSAAPISKQNITA